MKQVGHKTISLLFLLVAFFACNHRATADEGGQTISVTPPLFQLSEAPGSAWRSVIKVINSNRSELTVYAELVDFAPEGEVGQGSFIKPTTHDEMRTSLAEWIELSPGPYTIPPEQSIEIPFTIMLEPDTPPGGHFAAILISTKPLDGGTNQNAVLTTQTVTSLIFLRVAGDIVESGTIREFSMVDRFVESPDAEFSLRFENKGNVHLQPKGNIVITNMWGKERGVIPVNHQTHYGNVLPTSIRDFRFSWSGERSIAEIGRYKAIATLGYGEDGIKSTDATTYFWVVPIKATLITLSILIAFIFFVIWAIRLYIRRMLALAGIDIDTMEHVGTAHTLPDDDDVRLVSYTNVSAPIRTGALDLRERLRGVTEFVGVFVTILSFIWNYKRFFGALLTLILGFIGMVLYIHYASRENVSYEVRIKEADQERVITQEEIDASRLEAQ